MTTLSLQLKRIWDAMHPAEGIPDHLRRFKGHLEAIDAGHQELARELEIIVNALVAFTPSQLIVAFLTSEVTPAIEELAGIVASLDVGKVKANLQARDEVVEKLRVFAGDLAKGNHPKLIAPEGKILPPVDEQLEQITVKLTALVNGLKGGSHDSVKRTTHAQSRLASLEDLVTRIQEALAEIKRLEAAGPEVPTDLRMAARRAGDLENNIIPLMLGAVRDIQASLVPYAESEPERRPSRTQQDRPKSEQRRS